MVRATLATRRAVQHIADALSVEAVSNRAEHDVFHSPTANLWKPANARGVFGGQVLGQALMSAGHTIREDMSLHSVHSQFLLGADPREPIEYQVQRLRDGGKYASRSTLAQQHGRTLFIAMSSYHAGEPEQPSYQLDITPPWAAPPGSHTTTSDATWVKTNGLDPLVSLPVVPGEPSAQFSTDVAKYTISLLPPEQSRPTEERFLKLLVQKGDTVESTDPLTPNLPEAIQAYLADRASSPFEIRDADPNMWDEHAAPVPGTRQAFWLRARDLVRGEQPSPMDSNKLALTYASDFNFLPTITKALGLRKASMIVTLSHSMYFYRTDFDAHDWMLFAMQAQAASNGRGVVFGRIYRRDGALIAIAVQEGVLRAGTSDKKREAIDTSARSPKN